MIVRMSMLSLLLTFALASTAVGQLGPPSVSIDVPSKNSTVSGTVAVQGWAMDNTSAVGTAINSVQVKVDGIVVGAATYGFSRPDVCAAFPGRIGCPNVGYLFQLNTATLSPGQHTLTVSASDTDTFPDTGSASLTFMVSAAASGQPPSVSIDAPANGAIVSGPVPIMGWAMDNTSGVGSAISNVQIKVDGVPVGTAAYGFSRPDVCAAYPSRPGCPNVGYSFVLYTNTLSTGQHTVTVSATDTDTFPDTGSASITLTVTPGLPGPPSLSIEQPANGAMVSGTVPVVGWAIDNTSAVGTAIRVVNVLVDGRGVG